MNQQHTMSKGLGERIRLRREQLSQTLRAVAKKADITAGYLCEIEKGRKNPSPKVLQHLAEALRMPMHELITISSFAAGGPGLSDRTVRKSAALRKNPTLGKYYSLLAECKVVVSAPGLFAWGGQFNGTNGGPEILTKLPLRLYMGAEEKKNGQLSFRERLVYNPTINDFERKRFNDPAASLWHKHRESCVQALCEDCADKQKIRAICNDLTFVMISEIPEDRGLSLTGAQAAAMAALLAVFGGLITAAEIDAWGRRPSATLLGDNVFQRVARLAMKIESMCFNTASGGARAVCPMLGNTTNPIIFASEARDGRYRKSTGAESRCTTSKDPDILRPRAVGDHFELYDQIRFTVSRLEELPGVDNTVEVPEIVDYGLIYPADPQPSASIVLHLSQRKDELQDVGEWVNQKWWPDASQEEAQLLKFLRLCRDDPRRQLGNCYTDPIIANAVEMIHCLVRIVSRGVSPDNLGRLYALVSRNNWLGLNLGVENVVADEIVALLQHRVRRLEHAPGIGITVTGPERCSDLFFVVRYHGLRDMLPEILTELCEFTGERLELDYASWIDGVEKDGLRAEVPESFQERVSEDDVSAQ